MSMDKKELFKLIHDEICGPATWGCETLTDKILALEAKGQVLVVSYGQFKDLPKDKDGCIKGQLIFIPTKGDKV